MRFLLPIVLFFIYLGHAQEYRLFCVGFYNVENFFDAVDDPKTFDDDYTPNGRKSWTNASFRQKAVLIASVIDALKNNPSQKPPVLLGLAEIENRTILEALLNTNELVPYGYSIIHFDSPDRRGIDVALLYQSQLFHIDFAKKYRLRLQSESKQYFNTTRDQLVVSGFLEGKPLVVMVNHWPSRRGGAKRSAPLRMAAARLQSRIKDSLERLTPKPQIIVMGDFNDNPDNKSVRLLTQPQKSLVEEYNEPLFNAMTTLYTKGVGSLAYNDRWHLFDQILLSESFKSRDHLFYLTTKIFNPLYLQTPEGRYKGYPYRTTQKGQLLNGYSDHFPVYVVLGLEL